MLRLAVRLPLFLPAWLAAILLLVPALVPCQERSQPQPGIPVNTTRLSDRLIVLDCLGVNVTAVATQKGVVIIDTHRSPSLMAEIAEVIQSAFGRRDVTHVINTHGDWDHTSGNQFFSTAQLIAHENCPEFMQHNRADAPGSIQSQVHVLDRARERLRSLEPDSEEARSLTLEIRARERLVDDLHGRYISTPPAVTFDDRLTLDMGDVRFELIFGGRAHTNNDILIYIPEERALLTGDLFCSSDSFCFPVTPLVDVPRLASELATILSADSGLDVVLPGHGAPLSRADLVALRTLLQERYVSFDTRRSAAARLDTMIGQRGLAAALVEQGRPVASGDSTIYDSEAEYYALGKRLVWENMLDEAIAVLDHSLTLFPQSALLYGGLGSAHLQNRDLPAAITCYEKSLELFPENRHAAELLRVLRE